MATYLYDDGELVEYTLGDDLNPPVRSLFLISDEETIFDVTIEFTDDEIIDVTLPLIASLNGKHYYSLPRKLFNFIDLQGPSGGGHVFLTKADLQTAVGAWEADSTSATATYGDINTWNVSAITNMYQLFKQTTITELDISNWDVSNVTNMQQMFFASTSLTSVNLSGWETSEVLTMEDMFNFSYNLETINVTGWDVGKVTTMKKVFYACGSVTELDVSNWDVGEVLDMYQMFAGCGVTELDLSNWEVSKVTDMSRMLSYMEKCTTINVSGSGVKWNVGEVLTMDNMFEGNLLLTSLNIGTWISNKVSTMKKMFSGCRNLPSITGTLTTPLVENMEEMFINCRELSAIDVSSWDVSKVKTMQGMFKQCYKLTTLNTSSWDTELLENIEQMFADCYKLTTLNTSSWTTTGLETIRYTFYNCSDLTDIIGIGNWDVSGVSRDNMTATFSYSNKLTSIDLSNWCVSHISTKPDSFVAESGGTTFGHFYETESNRPVWGTCPAT